MSKNNCVLVSYNLLLARKLVDLGLKIYLFPLPKLISKFKSVDYSYEVFETNKDLSNVSVVYADLENFAYEPSVESFLRFKY